MEANKKRNLEGLPTVTSPTPDVNAGSTSSSRAAAAAGLPQAPPTEPEKFLQQQQLVSQQRSQRIQQQLANYRPRRRRSKREPPMVPSPAFAAAVGLAAAACLLCIGGGVCFAKKCNGDTGLGLAMLILAGALLISAVVLFASLPCCFCDESRNCRVRDSCSLRWLRMRQRRDSRVHAAATATQQPTEGIAGKLGLPAITVRDYSMMETPPSPTTAGGTTPRTTGSSTVSFDDAGYFSSGGGGGRRNSMPPQLAWCYEGDPPDPSRLHPMYGRRRDSWSGLGGLTIVEGGGLLKIETTAARMPSVHQPGPSRLKIAHKKSR